MAINHILIKKTLLSILMVSALTTANAETVELNTEGVNDCLVVLASAKLSISDYLKWNKEQDFYTYDFRNKNYVYDGEKVFSLNVSRDDLSKSWLQMENVCKPCAVKFIQF